MTAHRYRDGAGHRVVVYGADRAFPEALGAEVHPGGETCDAEVGGLALFCASRFFGRPWAAFVTCSPRSRGWRSS